MYTVFIYVCNSITTGGQSGFDKLFPDECKGQKRRNWVLKMVAVVIFASSRMFYFLHSVISKQPISL